MTHRAEHGYDYNSQQVLYYQIIPRCQWQQPLSYHLTAPSSLPLLRAPPQSQSGVRTLPLRVRDSKSSLTVTYLCILRMPLSILFLDSHSKTESRIA